MATPLHESIIKDARVRRALTRQSHLWFFHVFLSAYVEYRTALFQEEMFRLTENRRHNLIGVMAFRGSGKSTIMNLSYSLWSVLGNQQKKFIIIISKTQAQAKSHFSNIRAELERNELLSADLGPFRADEDTWGMHTITLTRLEAKIVAISREQSIRGMRHGANRPDLIICDDVEDSVSVASEDERECTYRWFLNEVIPAGKSTTRIILLGNLLSENSLIMRIKKDIEEKRIKGIFRAYPLLDDGGRIMWPGKFRSLADIEENRKKFSDLNAWRAEYLLAMVSPSADVRIILDGSGLNGTDVYEVWEKEEWKMPPRKLGSYRISAPTVHGPSIHIAREIWQKNSKRTAAENNESDA